MKTGDGATRSDVCSSFWYEIFMSHDNEICLLSIKWFCCCCCHRLTMFPCIQGGPFSSTDNTWPVSDWDQFEKSLKQKNTWTHCNVYYCEMFRCVWCLLFTVYCGPNTKWHISFHFRHLFIKCERIFNFLETLADRPAHLSNNIKHWKKCVLFSLRFSSIFNARVSYFDALVIIINLLCS